MLISGKSRLPPPTQPKWPGLRCYGFALLLPWSLSLSHAASASARGESNNAAAGAAAESKNRKSAIMYITIGTGRFAVTLTDSAASRAFAEQLPLTLEMPDLNGNEKHAQLPTALPAHATRPGTIRNGDLMLYGSTTLVLFYKTFDSSYDYTPLGRVNDPEGLAAALGARDVRVTFATDKI
jgi:hypothetical protein